MPSSFVKSTRTAIPSHAMGIVISSIGLARHGKSCFASFNDLNGVEEGIPH
jgi:hypothetical protein